MSRHARILAWTLVTMFGALVGAAASGAAGVAYIKDGQVWVSNLDGTKKVQLSSGNAWWNDVGQSASGGIVATSNEPGKISQLTTFTVWNANGTEKDFGPASPGNNFAGSSLAAPLGLELDPTNGLLIYGFSSMTSFPPYSLTTGYALLPSSTRSVPPTTFTNSLIEWPTLVAGRIIGSPDGHAISVENAGGNNTGPFTTWPAIALTNVTNGKLHRVQSSDDGQVLGLEVDIHDANNVAADDSKIRLIGTTGLLGSYVDDCDLQTSGKAPSVDISADGTTVAWADADGVKLAGTPAFHTGGPATCELSRAPSLVEAGATHPALGPIDVDALYAARNPAPGTTTTTTTTTTANPTTGTPTLTTPKPGQAPAVAVPAGLTAATLLGGSPLSIAVGKAGKVVVTVTVSASSVGRKGTPITVATGSATAKKAGALTIKLRATKAGRKLRKKLKGKRVTITVRANGKATTRKIKLG